MYGFARRPDLTLFFNTPLSVALGRILSGRPQLKYHEAGMDMGISADPYESFRIFQERIYNEYLAMKEEFSFVTMDGSVSIEEQQARVRDIVSGMFDLPAYRWKNVV
jgi:dTMP kinase